MWESISISGNYMPSGCALWSVNALKLGKKWLICCRRNFESIFAHEFCCIFIHISLRLPRVRSKISPHWFKLWLGKPLQIQWLHHDDVIMGAIASQITRLTIVYSIVYSDADQRKHQSSASLAFVWGIHRGHRNGGQPTHNCNRQ